MTINSFIKIKVPDFNVWQLMFIVIWTRYTILRWVELLLNRLTVFTYVTPYLFYAIIIFITIIHIKEIINTIKFSDFVFIALFLILWFVSKAIHSEMLVYYEQYQNVFLDCIFYFFVGRKVATYIDNYFVKSIYFCSIIGIILTAINLFVLIFSGTYSKNTEFMDLAYKLLPSILCVIGNQFRDTKKNYIFAVLSFIFLFFLGTRGPLLICIIYFAILLFFVLKKRSFRIVLISSTLALLLLDHFYGLLSVLLSLLNNIAVSFGFSNRIMMSLLSGEFLFRDNRDEIINILIDKIKDNPNGYGLFSDRYYTIGIWGSTEGRYAHNLLYEFWMNFGIVFGTLVIVFLGYIVIKSIINKKLETNQKFLSLILISSGIIKLFFSGSWITDQLFFLCLGFCLTLVTRRTRESGTYNVDFV